jgi:two-component system, NarL family, nitrate/nitrite response regulator NarL
MRGQSDHPYMGGIAPKSLNNMSISIFAFESQPITVRGLRAFADEEHEISFAGSAASSTEALDRMRELPSDIVLVDQSAGLRTALQFVSDLRQISPRSNAILWVHEQSEIDGFRAIQMGVRAVLRKTVALDTLLECVRTVAAGNIWMEQSADSDQQSSLRPAPKLTPREREIASCVCKGMRNREIAERLTITPGTVKVHLMHIFEKTGVKDRFELAIHGRRLMGLDAVEVGGPLLPELETTRVA